MSTATHIVATENGEEQDLTLLRQVCEVSKAVVEDRLDFSALHENIMQFEKFIFSLDHDEARAKSVLRCLAPDMISNLNGAYSLWESSLEYQFAEALIQGRASLSDYPLYDRFEELIRRELALISDVRPTQILVIGSGPFPVSAIHVHLQTGLPVDCVSRSLDAVSISRQVLSKCGLDSSVRVFPEGDAAYAACSHDLMLIELLARSKRPILRNLRKRNPGAPILCRTSLGVRRLVHETTSDRDLRGFYIKGQQVAQGMQTISTWVLEPAVSAATGIRLEWLRDIDVNQGTQILQLMNRTLEEETTIGFPGPLDDETGYVVMRQLRADVEAGRRHVLVAIKDGAIVGQLILTPNSTPNHHHIVELTRGVIDPSFRGGGLALLAFEEVARKCEELKREVICLDVRVGTMAAIWWQHFGFKPYGLLPDYSRVGKKRYQGLFLTQTNDELKQRIKEIRASSATQSYPPTGPTGLTFD